MIWWAIVLLAVFLIGVTKSGFGAGVGLMIVPMTTIAMGHTWRGSEATLGLMLPLLVAGDLFAVWQYRRLLRRGSQAVAVLRRLAPGMIVGVVIGGLLLSLLHKRADLVGALIRIEIGLESIGLVALYWWQQYRGIQTRTMREPWRSHLIGAFSAISSTLAHAAGPIIAMLSGAGVGGAVGGVAGGLIGAGMPEYEAKRYEGRMKSGGILLSVHCDDSNYAKRAKAILEETGAEDISSMGEPSADFSKSDEPKRRSAGDY